MRLMAGNVKDRYHRPTVFCRSTLLPVVEIHTLYEESRPVRSKILLSNWFGIQSTDKSPDGEFDRAVFCNVLRMNVW